MEIIYEKNKEIFRKIAPMLTAKRLKHTEGVRNEAVRLAIIYGVSPEGAELASICHDIFRGKTAEELDKLVAEYSLPEKYMGNSNLSHGKLAYCYMKETLGIGDEDILNAVSFHTTGRVNMSTLEKIIFIADAIEVGRNYPGVEDMRKKVDYDIDGACLMSLEGTVKHLMDIGMKLEDIDRDTIEAIEFFKNKR